MAPRKSIATLEEMCWQTIVCRFEHLERQAENLPTFFIDKLYKRLCKEEKYFNLQSNLFLHPKATNLFKLSLDLMSETKVKKLSRVCKNLRRIVLPGTTPESLTTIAINNPLLIHLDINGTNQLTDHQLFVISKHCPQLQYLSLKNVKSYNITDNCMEHLPTTLTFLNIKNTCIAPWGCVIALKRLKSLKQLKYHFWDEIFNELSPYQSKPIFSIEVIKVCHEISSNVNLGKIIAEMFPKLRDIRLIRSSVYDIVSLARNHKLNLITRLEASLSFHDIFFIGKLCPMLEKLVVSLSRNRDDGFRYDGWMMLGKDECVPFKQLRTLRLWMGVNYDFQFADLQLLLADIKWLKSLEIYKWRQLEDRVIFNLLQLNLLRGIESFKFYECAPFTVAALVEMIRCADSLKFMKISYCESILNKQITILKKLIHDENWDVSLSHH